MSKATERDNVSPVPANFNPINRPNNDSPLRVEQDSPRAATVAAAAAVALPRSSSASSLTESELVAVIGNDALTITVDRELQNTPASLPTTPKASSVRAATPLADPEQVSPRAAPQEGFAANIESARAATPPAAAAAATPAPTWGDRIKAQFEKLSCCAPGSRGK